MRVQRSNNIYACAEEGTTLAHRVLRKRRASALVDGCQQGRCGHGDAAKLFAFGGKFVWALGVRCTDVLPPDVSV